MGNYKCHSNRVFRLPFDNRVLEGSIYDFRKVELIVRDVDKYAFECKVVLFPEITQDSVQFCSSIKKADVYLSIYNFLNQSLQINDFRTSFKNPTSSKHPEKVRLINDGEDPITIHSISTEGDQFYIQGFDDAMELSPGEELNLDLFFRPDQYGFYTSRLIIKTSMPEHEEISIDLFGVRKRGKSYYRYIYGERYDRLLLEIAYSVMSQNPDKVIDYDQIRIITRSVWDAGYITTTEKRSLRYIWDNYDWSDNARKWFRIGYGESVGIN